MPAAVAFPVQLLDQADHLIRRDRFKPSQANLRRAISTAYYAVFHLLGEEAGRRLVRGSKDRQPLRTAVARALDHGSLRAACERVSSRAFPGNLPASLRPCMTTVSSDLQNIAAHFVALEDMRHRADYDRSNPMTRLEAQDAILRARESLGTWSRVRGSTEAAFLLVAAIGWRSLSGRREA